MGQQLLESIGRRISGAVDNLIATVVVQFVAVGCIVGGWFKQEQSDSSSPAWQALLFSGVALFGFTFLNYVHIFAVRWLRRRRIGSADATRLSVLLARIAGDDDAGTLREIIRDAIVAGLGSSVELIVWDESLALSDGKDEQARSAAAQTAQAWLSRTGCDVLIWGRARGPSVMSLRITGRGHQNSELVVALEGVALDVPRAFTDHLTSLLCAILIVEADQLKPQTHGHGGVLDRLADRLRHADFPGRPALNLTRALVLGRLARQAGDVPALAQALSQVRQAIQAEGLVQADLSTAALSLISLTIELAELSQSPELGREAIALIEQIRANSRDVGLGVNYGIALSIIGGRDQNESLLRQAIHEFDEVLASDAQLDDQTLGQAWHNRGISFSHLASIMHERYAYDAALLSLQNALEYRLVNREPLYWAKTKLSLGGLQTHWGRRVRDVSILRSAIDHSEAALEIMRQEGHRAYVEDCLYNLCVSLESLASIEKSSATLARAMAVAAELVDSVDPVRRPPLAASVQSLLASISIAVALSEGSYHATQDALAALDAAQSLIESSDAVASAGLRRNRAHALSVAAHIRPSEEAARRAIAECRAVLHDAAAANDTFTLAQAQGLLATALEIGARTGDPVERLRESAKLHRKSLSSLPSAATTEERAMASFALALALARVFSVTRHSNDRQRALTALHVAKRALEGCRRHPLINERHLIVVDLLAQLGSAEASADGRLA